MEKKEMGWKLEEETQQAAGESVTEKEQESKIDKTALADFILSKLPSEMVEMLEKGETPQNLIVMWENRMLKKENQELKSRLAKETHKPLKLADEGGKAEKDPFVAGFIQAMANY